MSTLESAPMGALLPELDRWCAAVLLRWFNLFAGVVVSALWAIYQQFTGAPVPMNIFWCVVGACVLWACFLAWREEHQKARRISVEKVFEDCLQILARTEAIFPVGILNDAGAFRLASNKDVLSLCKRWEQSGHGDPFEGCEEFVSRKELLAFLRYAHDRLLDIGGSDFTAALETWREESGKPEPSWGAKTWLIFRKISSRRRGY